MQFPEETRNDLRAVYNKRNISTKVGFQSAIKVVTFLLVSLVENDSSLMGKSR
jgi:hypothetical protein